MYSPRYMLPPDGLPSAEQPCAAACLVRVRVGVGVRVRVRVRGRVRARSSARQHAWCGLG